MLNPKEIGTNYDVAVIKRSYITSVLNMWVTNECYLIRIMLIKAPIIGLPKWLSQRRMKMFRMNEESNKKTLIRNGPHLKPLILNGSLVWRGLMEKNWRNIGLRVVFYQWLINDRKTD